VAAMTRSCVGIVEQCEPARAPSAVQVISS